MSFEINYKEDLVSENCDIIDGYSIASVLKAYLKITDNAAATALILTLDIKIPASLKLTPNH